MDMSTALAISARGMQAQTARLRVIAENLANQDTTGSSPGAQPYRRKTISFANQLDRGLGIELVLTFFFVLAMFSTTEQAPAPWLSGAVLAAAVLFAGPLTGAALNPARWLGPVFWQTVDGTTGSMASRQALVYIAGPIVGALLAGAFAFRIYLPARLDAPKNAGL